MSGGTVKRDIESMGKLLKALVYLSINIDETLKTLNAIRSATAGEGEGDRGEIDILLQLVDDEARNLHEVKKRIKKIRSNGEKIVWNRQKTSPHLDHPVGNLKLSTAAAKCIPFGVETIGQLCQHSPSELLSAPTRIKHEIMDMLRISYGLVLKPKD